MKHVVIGTAGHVDHGKTALVRALTGVDTDRLAEEKLAAGKKVGIICTEETKNRYPEGMLESIGTRSRQETIAHNLFAVLRDFDDRGAEYIFSEGFAEDHLGQAIMNRMKKAAGYHILHV